VKKLVRETMGGSVELAQLTLEEIHVLGVIQQAEKYEPRLLLEACRCLAKEGTGGSAESDGGVTRR
jgi:hypothetical protein